MLGQVVASLRGNALKSTGLLEAAEIEIGSAGEENGRVILHRVGTR